MILEGYRPPIYTVLYILYSRITTAVGCLSSVNSLYGRKTVFYGRIGLFYGRIAFNTYESGYNKSAKNVPTIAVIPTESKVFNISEGVNYNIICSQAYV